MSNNGKRPRKEVQNQNDSKKAKVSESSNAAKEIEVVINNNNTNCNANMDRKFEYSISSGFVWQPCQKPYESECNDNVKLGFNYWMNNDKILDADVTELIISLLFGRPSPSFMSKDSTESIGNIVVAIVTGVGPIHLAKEISQLKFLSQCTCVPVRHSALDGYQWKPYDTEFMPSLLLWPLKSPMSLKLVYKIGLQNLFKYCHVLFNADCNHWYDQISFQCDMNVMDSVNNYIDTIKVIDSKSTLPVIKYRDGDIIGRFKRRTNGDKGYFLIRKRKQSTIFILYLLWQKHFPDILYEHIVEEQPSENTDLPPPIFMSHASRNLGSDPEEALGIIFSPFRMILNSAVCINTTVLTDSNGNNDIEYDGKTTVAASHDIVDNDELVLDDNEANSNIIIKEYSKHDDNNTVTITIPTDRNSNIHSSIGLTFSAAINNNDSNTLSMDEEKVESIDSIVTDSKVTVVCNQITTSSSNTNGFKSLIDTYRSLASTTNIEINDEETLSNNDDLDCVNGNINPLFHLDCVNGNISPLIHLSQPLPDVNEAVRDESLRRLKTDLEELLASPKGMLELESMVLSKNMLELFGYPIATDTSLSGFVCTHSLRWRPVATTIMPQEIEEGEESEGEAVGEDAVGRGREGILVSDETLTICALDCEMVTTEGGLELARLTVVSADKGVVLDMMVKPERPVIDYNTAYSGITEALLRPVTTRFSDAMQKLRKLISGSTIIIGHSLDCDLRTLRLIHYRVIDTAALYPHPRGAPYKHGLKKLALDILGQSVQTSSGTNGHDSIQDALVAFELVLLKAKRGEFYGIPPPWPLVDGQESIPRVSIRERIIEEENNHRENIRIDEAINDNSVKHCYVHSCGPLATRPAWEQHAFGYKSEGNAYIAFSNNSNDSNRNNNNNNDHQQQLLSINEKPLSPPLPLEIQQQKEEEVKIVTHCKFYCKEHKSVQSVLRHSLDDLQHESDSPSLFWLDMPVDLTHYSYGNLPDVSSDSDTTTTWSSLTDVDESLTKIYESMSRGSMLLVLTQGDLAEVRKLVIRKQRFWWESAPSYRKVVGCAPVTWTPDDEEHLIKASAHVLAGALFLRKKPL